MHSVLKSALQYAVREDELPRNVVRNVPAGTTAAGDGGAGESVYVFTTPTGRPIDHANLTRALTTLLNPSGLRRVQFHDLRHTAVTPLFEQGVELVVIKELLGHAHIGVTAAVYAHVRPRLRQAAITALSNVLSADTAPSGTAATP